MISQTSGGPRMSRQNFHPAVYKAMLGLALWLVLSTWAFAGGGDTDFLLTVVSIFIGISVALPLVALRTWQRHRHSGRPGAGRFRDWASGDLETWQGKLPAAEAAVQALLPIAAVAFGMTVFALVRHFAV